VFPDEFEKNFKLITSFKTSNMVAFNNKGHIHKYKDVNEIIDEYYEVRLNAYKARKEYLLKKLDELICELSAKYKFVKLIVEDKLKVMKVSDEILLAGLKEHKFPPLSSPFEYDDLKSYEYLLRMRIDRLKASSLEELKKELDERILDRDELFETTEEELWTDDLELFEVAYKEYCAVRMATYASGESGIVKKKRATKKA
jgi:DNA topoisomerase-2